MRFDQDNTITDQPMVELVTALQQVLEGAAARAAAGGAGGGALHQLVLVIADGRCVRCLRGHLVVLCRCALLYAARWVR